MEQFARSDLAAECGADSDTEGIRVQRSEAEGLEILRVQVKTREAAARIGKPEGRYVTVECGDIRELDSLEAERVRRSLAVELRDMAQRMCGKRVGRGFSVLVVGLGNAELTADAVGPETVKRLCVTRHLRQSDTLHFGTLGLCEIAALAPGVLGQTGLEAAEVVRGAVSSICPDLVVAVDALAARSPERLASTVQLSDTGIQPGSGVGNARRALTEETVGVPVLALGVPTVVESATLVADALRRAGYGELAPQLRQSLAAGQNLLVTPKEIDVLVCAAALLLAQTLEKAFSLAQEM